METTNGVKLNTDFALEEIIKGAKKEIVFLPVITPNMKSGFIKLRVKTNSQYAMLDMDFYTDYFNHDLSPMGAQTIKQALLNYLAPLMPQKRLNERLVVSKTFITTPTLKGQATEVLKLILQYLEAPANLQPISTI